MDDEEDDTDKDETDDEEDDNSGSQGGQNSFSDTTKQFNEAKEQFASQLNETKEQFKEFTDKLAEFDRRIQKMGNKQDSSGHYLSPDIEVERDNFVENYPIPNTKEDLLEFFMLCYSKMKERRGDKDISIFIENTRIGLPCDHWGTKCIHVYQKVETVLPDEKALLKRFTDSLRTKGVLADTEERAAAQAKWTAKWKARKLTVTIIWLAVAALILFPIVRCVIR